MRRTLESLTSGIGRRAGLAVLATGALVLMAGVLLQAGKQQRQFRGQHQVQLQQVARQGAAAIAARVESAESILYVAATAESADDRQDGSALRARVMHTGAFSRVDFLDFKRALANPAGSSLGPLTAEQTARLAAGQSVVTQRAGALGTAEILILTRNPKAPTAQLICAALDAAWLWKPIANAPSAAQFIALDQMGRVYYAPTTQSRAAALVLKDQLHDATDSVAAQPMSWNAVGNPWVGAKIAIGGVAATMTPQLSVIAATTDRPWSLFFWSALRTQLTLLPLVALLAAVLAFVVNRSYGSGIRKVSAGLALLPQNLQRVEVGSQADADIRELAESFNKASNALETQRELANALEDLDDLLLNDADYESVMDKVLDRVRLVTKADNVGLTLLDVVGYGHGRLFAVNAAGGFPVNRVMMDRAMMDALREAKAGLTIARYEAVRHSFLDPLHDAGSGFFWVWPVLANDNVAAVLSVGYRDPPNNAEQLAQCGTKCARHLSFSLAKSARAERLYRQANFDPLTQLPNRTLFLEQLSQELLATAQSRSGGALLFIDLDHFKKVNDTSGHAAGDKLLAVVAQRLRACVKDDDTVARLAGDEFTIILRNMQEASPVTAVAERILEAMHLPIHLDGKDHSVGASIGVTMYPADGTTVENLIRNADLAMYQAKEQGRGAAVFYNPKIMAKVGLAADSGLYRALKRREFSLYFQPQYRVSDGALVGMEALLRWQKPHGAVVSSADFIPAAEETGLIVNLGAWVIDAACAQVAKWRDLGVKIPTVSVNLSVQQLREPTLAVQVRRSLEAHRISAGTLEFELSEASLTDPDTQLRIKDLAALGIRLALDDFGTGHTALANLRRYPVSTVKIDRSFVADIASSPASAALASTIIVMAHSLGKKVVAEGVETIEQLDYLRERGCDVAQGFFLAHPLAADEATEMLVGPKQEASNWRAQSA